MAGLIIAFSGVESSGKSTQIDLLLDHLKSQECKPIYLWTRPGYTPLMSAAKRTLRGLSGRRKAASEEGVSEKPGQYPKRAGSFRSSIKRRMWLTVSLADLFWTYCIYLRLLRLRGRTVLLDRYLMDAIVDFRVNFPDQQVDRGIAFRLVRRFAAKSAAAYCLLIPAKESIKRTQSRARQHWEVPEIVEQKESLYRTLADEVGAIVIDGCQSPESIGEQLRQDVDKLLDSRR